MGSVTHVLRIRVTDVARIYCYLCLRTVHRFSIILLFHVGCFLTEWLKHEAQPPGNTYWNEALRGFFLVARLLAGACRHFENASITLPLCSFASACRTDIIEIKVLYCVEDEAIQCLCHWFILEPGHSSESEYRIAAYLRDIRTSANLCVHFLHLH